MYEVDVVILSWAKNPNLKQLTEKGINTLLKSENENNVKFNVFLLESITDINYDFPSNVHIIHMYEKFGYHKFMNIGRKMGNAKYVALCNNDLRYQKNWASNIIKEMESDKNLLSACPVEPVVNMLSKHYTDDKYGYETRKFINGWCIFQKRVIYDLIGDLDEQFEFWCCDDEYGMTLEGKKIKHALIKESVVNHDDNGGKSLHELTPDVAKQYTGGGIEIFKKKYGHLPKYMMK
jgi:hypothetical protein